MERFDAIVVGAGPAGSAAAHRLAAAGASVLLLDRARFPRDKPCGGGLTGRALRLLPEPVDSVVEDRATRVRLRARYRGGFELETRQPLVVLTQRARLDAFLAERAEAAGALFRDGARVTGIDGTTVRLEGGGAAAGDVLIGADGANGLVARALGFADAIEHGVALEGKAPYDSRYRGSISIEFGVVRGGYGWVFPKADHLNVGVGGWGSEGPQLRRRLHELCRAYRLDPESVTELRGHRLPQRRAPGALVNGRAVLVGDAAGLVDPLTGDGIYEALLSAQLAADAALGALAGDADELAAYPARLWGAHARHLAASWKIKRAFDRQPHAALTLARLAWSVAERVLRGDLLAPGDARGPVRVPLRALDLLGR